MRESDDSSIWKSLAVAFGDGLAFGVGVKLTQNAQREKSLPAAAPGAEALLERLDRMEDRMKRIESAPGTLDPQILDAVTAALDARLHEHVSHLERRLAEMEARLLMDTKALEQQDRSLATRMEQDLATLKGQVIAINREFAEQVGRIVAEQVNAQVKARTAELEPSLRAHAMDAVDDAVQERLAPMRAELAGKDHEIAELRQRLSVTDSTISGFILAMGEMCRQAVERLAPPAAPGSETAPRTEPRPSGTGQGSQDSTPAPAEDAAPDPPLADPPEDPGAELRAHFDRPAEPPVPSFSELRKPPGFWRMPMVSSFVVTAASLAMLRFL